VSGPLACPLAYAQTHTVSLVADSITLTDDGWRAEGNVRLQTPRGELTASAVSLDAEHLVVQDGRLTVDGLEIRVQSATVNLSTGVIKGEALYAVSGTDGPVVRARTFTLTGDRLEVANANLRTIAEVDRAQRRGNGWTVEGAALLAGGVAVWPDGDDSLPDDTRRSGLLPPWLGYRQETGLESGAGAFLTLGDSWDLGLGAFGGQAGDAGADVRLRHIGGGVAGTWLFAQHNEATSELAGTGAGALGGSTLRYDVDWASAPELRSGLRIHPWHSSKLGQRLGSPARTAAATGLNTWHSTADLAVLAWQPHRAPQQNGVEAGLGLSFGIAGPLRSTASLGYVNYMGPAPDALRGADRADLGTAVHLPLYLGRVARLRSEAGLSLTAITFELDSLSGPEIAARQTLRTAVSSRLDTRLRGRLAAASHTITMEIGAWGAPADISTGDQAPPLSVDPFELEPVAWATAARLGQRFGEGTAATLDLGVLRAKVDGEVLARAGAGASWGPLRGHIEADLSAPPRLGYALGVDSGQARLRFGASLLRVPAGLLPAKPLHASLPTEITIRSLDAAATGATTHVQAPLWPDSPLLTTAYLFLPLNNRPVDPEISVGLRLGRTQDLSLSVVVSRRTTPAVFDAVATFAIAGF
jgi:hypothetical protein